MWNESGFLTIDGNELEFKGVGPSPEAAPTIVLLHEGLGCVGMWGDFPEKLSAATGAGVLGYSRRGYGRSSPAELPRSVDFMHREARVVLPGLLDAIGFRDGLLVGHSDGASIAAIFAGSTQDHRVRGHVMIAPHFIVEDVTINSIRELRTSYEAGDLRERFARWHDDPDATVRGWTDAWLNGDFRNWDLRDDLAHIRVPILIVQGEHDQYATMRQIQIAQEECYCPVDVLVVPGAKHAPHREATETTLAAIVEFYRRLFEDSGAGTGDMAACAKVQA